MKFMKSIAVLAIAAATANAGTVNWVLEEAPAPFAEGSGYWGFLIKGDYNSLGVVDFDGDPLNKQLHLSGVPLLQWNNTAKELVLVGGAGQIAAIAMLNTHDFNAGYGIYEETDYPLGLDHPAIIDIADASGGLQNVYNDRKFHGFGALPQWEPEEGFYYMIMFDLDDAGGPRYKVANTYQYSVGYDDVTRDYDGDEQLDPFFPVGEIDSPWYKLMAFEEEPDPDNDGEFIPKNIGLFNNSMFSGAWANNTTIPEPMTATLVALGCVMFGLRRRVRRG